MRDPFRELRDPTGPQEPVRPSRRTLLRLAAAAGLGLAAGGAVLGGLGRLASLERVRSSRTLLGTSVTLTVLHSDPEAAETLLASGFAKVERLERIFSRYVADGALARLNREGALENPPGELIEVLEAAIRLSEASGGAFDPTVTPLVKLFRPPAEGSASMPTASELAAARDRVGVSGVRISEHRIAFGRPGMALTLDGIAKGFILDRTVRWLASGGATSALAEAGGDFASASAGRTTPGWQVAVQDPRAHSETIGIVRLRHEALATSGDYADAYTPDRRLHHIIDPRTGHSPTHTAAATVLAPTAMEADALATTLLVLGADASLELLEFRTEVEAMIISKDLEIVTTPGFRDHLA